MSCRQNHTSEPEIVQLVDKLIARGLDTPFLFFVESHRPLRGVMFHGLLIAQPLLSLFFGGSNLNKILRIMESDEELETLIQLIGERKSKGNELDKATYGS